MDWGLNSSPQEDSCVAKTSPKSCINKCVLLIVNSLIYFVTKAMVNLTRDIFFCAELTRLVGGFV